MPRKQQEEFRTTTLLDDFITEAYQYIGSSSMEPYSMSVIEFAEDILFNGVEKLFSPQKAVLKAIYNEPLTVEEKEILKDWKGLDRTNWKEGKEYSDFSIECGRGGGKTTLMSIIMWYEFYNLYILDDPSKFYNLFSNSPIAIFCIGTSQDQVEETLFKYIKGYGRKSNYFRNLHKNGKIRIMEQEIRCDDKNIAIYAKHTNSESLVGYSLKALCVDEAARFPTDAFGKSKAEELWRNVGKGCQTRFGRKGFRFVISSAWEEGDYMEKMYELGRKTPSLLTFRFRTWDLNKSAGVAEAVLKTSTDYIDDPITAALEFEGIRPPKRGTFFLKESVDSSFRGENQIEAEKCDIEVSNPVAGTRVYVGVNIIDIIPPPPKAKLISFAHVDYGVKKDSAALAICHPEIIDNNVAVVVDSILVWKPETIKDAQTNKVWVKTVSFLDVELKCRQLAKERNIAVLSFDQYQSQHSIQSLHALGVRTEEMATTNKAQESYYLETKKLMDKGLLVLPRDCIWTPIAKQEFLNLIRYPNGRIDHPNQVGASKDVADAVVNAVFNCLKWANMYGYLSNGLSLGVKTVAIQHSNRLANHSLKNSAHLLTGADKVKQTRGY